MYAGHPTQGVKLGGEIMPLNTPNYNVNLNYNRIIPPVYSLKRFSLNRRTAPQTDKIRVQRGQFTIKNTAYSVNDNYNRQIVLSPQYEL